MAELVYAQRSGRCVARLGSSSLPLGTTLSVVKVALSATPDLSVFIGTLSVPPQMYYVYILLSEKDGKLYIGSAPDLRKRIEKHENGYVLATKHRRPLKLIYYEAYISSSDARHREIFLKGGKGHDELKIQLKDSFRKSKYKFS